jgi:hypothetical protein
MSIESTIHAISTTTGFKIVLKKKMIIIKYKFDTLFQLQLMQISILMFIIELK